VLDAIYCALEEYTAIPTSVEQWKAIERGFAEKWNFPGCFGPIDGKHVVIRAPLFSGSEYYNYMQDFSIVPLAMVDATYCFRYVDIGAPGRHSEGGIFNHCSLKNKIENNELNIPENFVMIGDSACCCCCLELDHVEQQTSVPGSHSQCCKLLYSGHEDFR
jgi:hypothetical protein